MRIEEYSPTTLKLIGGVIGSLVGIGMTVSILLTCLFIYMFFGFGWGILAACIAGYMQNLMEDPEYYVNTPEEDVLDEQVSNLIIAWKVWMVGTWIIIGICLWLR